MENLNNFDNLKIENLRNQILEEIIRVLYDFFSQKTGYIFSIIDRDDNYQASRAIFSFLEKLPVIVGNLLDSEKIFLKKNTENDEYTEFLHICEKCDNPKCTLESIMHIIIREYAEILLSFGIEDDEFDKTFFDEYKIPSSIKLDSIKTILRQYAVFHDMQRLHREAV